MYFFSGFVIELADPFTSFEVREAHLEPFKL